MLPSQQHLRKNESLLEKTSGVHVSLARGWRMENIRLKGSVIVSLYNTECASPHPLQPVEVQKKQAWKRKIWISLRSPWHLAGFTVADRAI